MTLAEVIPQLPDDISPVDDAFQVLFSLGQIPPLVIAIVLAVRWSKQHGTPIPLLFLAGGGLAMFNEPIVDHNAAVWFPTDGQWTLYTTFGIAQPVWLATAYIWFFGGQPMVVWHLLQRGLPARRLWKAFAAVVVVDIILEHPGLYADLFFYYGNQPFKLTRFPLWWGVINATTPIVAASLVYMLQRELTGRRVFGMLLLVPIVQAATNAGAGFPVWNVINTDLPTPVVWAAGFATIGLCTYLVHLCTIGVSAVRRRPDAGPVAAPEPAAVRS